MADKEWYYSDGEEQLGPVSSAELKKLAEGGTLKPDFLVWCEGMDDWQPAGKLKGLLPERKPEAAPRPARSAARPAARAATKAGPSADQPQAPAEGSIAQRWLAEKPEPESPPAAAAVDIPLDVGGRSTQPAPAQLHETPAIGPPPAEPEAPPVEVPGEEAGPPLEDDLEDEEFEEDDRPAAPSQTYGRAAAGVELRPAARPDEAGGILAFLQLAIWCGALVAVLAGVPLFLGQWNRAEDAAGRTSAAVTYLLLLGAVYVLVRAGERILQLLGQLGKGR